MPRFSIIIPTFGRPELLAEAIASVRSQAFSDFECIVVDDGSPSSATVPDDARFRLVRRDANGGPAAAVNTGLAQARGDYVIRMDDDDLFTNDRLDMANEAIARAPVGLCWARFVDEEPSPKRLLDGAIGATILDDTTPHMGTVAVERRLFLPLDESYLGTEDVEWWLRVAQTAPTFTVPRFGYLIRRHPAPRIRHGLGARISGSHRLLEEHATYFQQHRNAAAFRWKRIGLMELELGNAAQARSALLRSLRLRPQLRTAKHLIRAMRR